MEASREPDPAVARRGNRRGEATRLALLEAARHALASGDPGAASANLIARRAGATWGAVKYQFGDADGLWAALLDHLEERRGPVDLGTDAADPLEVRVRQVVASLWRGLEHPDARAMDTLRESLPRGRTEREAQYPRTTAALGAWNAGWTATCERAFADLDVPLDRVHAVAAFIPGTIRGLVSEGRLGTYTDLALAREGLVEAIVAYVGAPRGAPDPAADAAADLTRR